MWVPKKLLLNSKQWINYTLHNARKLTTWQTICLLALRSSLLSLQSLRDAILGDGEGSVYSWDGTNIVSIPDQETLDKEIEELVRDNHNQ